MSVAEEFAYADAKPRDRDMRHPWDDGIFVALARTHGLRVEDMECDANIAMQGWYWEPGDPETNRHYRLRGVPETMPTFNFETSSFPKTLTIDMPGAMYTRCGAKRRFIIKASQLPATIIACLQAPGAYVGKPLSRLISLPGADGIAISSIKHRSDGYVDVEIDFGDEETTDG